jgi:uncharacterized protein (DUF433 family)
MTAPTAPTRAPIERTEHPHIVKSADTLGGEPRVDGTRMPVRQLWEMAAAGMTVDAIIADFSYLTPAQVYDALSYAYDHPDEMKFHKERHKLRNILRELDLALVGNRFVARRELATLDVPPDVLVYTWETLPPQPDEQ